MQAKKFVTRDLPPENVQPERLTERRTITCGKKNSKQSGRAAIPKVGQRKEARKEKIVGARH